MTTLIFKFAATPQFDAIKRLGKAVNNFVEVVVEAKQMAREAQQRYPFAVE
jgi:hypothetical protein